MPRPFYSAGLALGSAVHSAAEWLHQGWKAEEDVSLNLVLDVLEADLYAQSLDGIRHAELTFNVPLTDLETGETLDISLEAPLTRSRSVILSRISKPGAEH